MHRSSTQFMSVLIILLGVAILVSTLVRSGLAFNYGIVLGPLFVAAGAGRLWASRKGV